MAFLVFLCRLHLAIFLITVLAGAWLIPSYGQVRPIDPNVWLGDTLELNCTITDDSITQDSDLLYFLQGNEVIPQRYTDRISSRTKRLRLPDIRREDETTYYCFLNRTVDEKHMGEQKIQVFHKPVAVQDINCTVDDWDSMLCTWDLGVNYHYPQWVDVSFVWVLESSNNNQYDCPHLTRTSCLWKEIDGPNSFKPNLIYRMRVIVENTKMNKSLKSRVFRINSAEKVKPAPPQELRIKSPNSTCVHVTWRVTHKARKKQCFVQLYMPLYENGFVEKHMTTVEEPEQMMTVCGLYPSQQYNVSVRCRSVDGGFLSDLTDAEHTMPQDAPSSAPELSVGSYTEIPCNNSNDGCRKVTVYWKPLPKLNQNGEIIAYEMLMNEEKTEISDVSANQGTRELILTRDFVVTVRARTRMGPSPDSVPIIIKSTSAKPSPPENFFVMGEEGSTEVTFHWTQPKRDSTDVTNYTIFYCQAWKDTRTCKGKDARVDGDLMWISVSSGQTNHTLVLQDRPQGYMFGISADTATYSSGLVWSTCTYHNKHPPTESPKNFRFADVEADRSLTLYWDRYSCEESGPILFYTLRFCPVIDADDNPKCAVPLQFVKISSRVPSYTLSGLEARRTYKASLNASTEEGSSPQTDWVFAKAVEKAPALSTGAIAGIVVGVFLVLFIIIGCCCYGCVKKDGLHPKEESIIIPPPLPDPGGFESYNDGSGYNTVPSSPQSPTSTTSLLPNGNANGTLTSDSSNTSGHTDDSGQVLILEKTKPNGSVDMHSDISKKLFKMPDGYSRFGVKTSQSSLLNGLNGGNEVKTLPHEKDHVVMFTTTAGKLVNFPNTIQLPLNCKGRKHPFSALSPPSQYQKNVIQAGTDSGSTGQSPHGSSSEIGNYARFVDGVLLNQNNNCLGSAVSLASSGGVLRQNTPPLPERFPSTDRELFDYEEPIKLKPPRITSTPVSANQLSRNLSLPGDGEDCLDQSYVRQAPMTLDSRSLPSILECGSPARRYSLGTSEGESSLSDGPEDSTDENGMVNELTCIPALTQASNGYISNGTEPEFLQNTMVSSDSEDKTKMPHPNVTLRGDGYVCRPDGQADEQKNRIDNGLTPQFNGNLLDEAESLSDETVLAVDGYVSHPQDMPRKGSVPLSDPSGSASDSAAVTLSTPQQLFVADVDDPLSQSTEPPPTCIVVNANTGYVSHPSSTPWAGDWSQSTYAPSNGYVSHTTDEASLGHRSENIENPSSVPQTSHSLESTGYVSNGQEIPSAKPVSQSSSIPPGGDTSLSAAPISNAPFIMQNGITADATEPHIAKQPVVDGYIQRLPDITVTESNTDTSVLDGSCMADSSKMSCSSVVRPISNYMRDLPVQYFLDPQAMDDFPTTEL